MSRAYWPYYGLGLPLYIIARGGFRRLDRSVVHARCFDVSDAFPVAGLSSRALVVSRAIRAEGNLAQHGICSRCVALLPVPVFQRMRCDELRSGRDRNFRAGADLDGFGGADVDLRCDCVLQPAAPRLSATELACLSPDRLYLRRIASAKAAANAPCAAGRSGARCVPP
jgi:hypothetical protein